MQESRILIIDDEKNLINSLVYGLSSRGIEAEGALDGRSGIERAVASAPDLVLLDLKLPDLSGLDVLQRLKEQRPDTPVIIISAHGDTRAAVEAVKAGAEDYFTKPFDLDELLHVIRRTVAQARLSREVAYRRRKTTEELGAIIGNSPAMVRLRQEVELVGRSVTRAVLILGQSGTGKALVARAIHRCSSRAEGSFVEVNCAALPETLLEAELFGAERGAYTGAERRRAGLVEYAEGGTLFLDEIGEMPASLQAKLLNFLDDYRFRPVGATRERRADIRVLAATNRDIAHEVAAQRFRADLYYRLNVVTIAVPPLAERGVDVTQLALHFARTIAAEAGCAPIELDRSAIDALLAYPWPGNVRELRNLIERLTILHPGRTIGRGDLPPEFRLAAPSNAESIADHLAATERAILQRTLEEVGGHKGRAAQELGISRHALKRRLKRLKLPE
ncbi:MAG: sigma-54-dependent transcriptional regulator [Kiloniellales bacterium]